MNEELIIPQSLRPIMRKAFVFTSCMLRFEQTCYPFAVISKDDTFKCIFADSKQSKTQTANMVEELQWKLIDQTIDQTSDHPIQSLLAYEARSTGRSDKKNAVTFEMSDENAKDYVYTFCYYWSKGKICFTGPLDTYS